MEIRPAVQSDLQAISDLAISAFGFSEGPEIVRLIAGLLLDATAQPILPQNADAWMVMALHPDVLGNARGRVICADALAKTEYWCE